MPLTDQYLRGAARTDTVQSILHPEEYRKQIYMVAPRTANVAPMTALLLGLGGSPCQSRIVHWAEMPYPYQTGTITGVFTDVALNVPYAGGGADGQGLNFQMSIADAKQIAAGHTLEVVNTTTMTPMMIDVTNVTIADANHTFVSGNLLMADTGNNLVCATTLAFSIATNAQPEMSGLSEPLSRELTEFTNITQIFMGSYAISGSEETELERFTPALKNRMREDALVRIHNEMEGAILRGYRKIVLEQGRRKQYMDGLYWMLAKNEPTNIINLSTYTSPVGTNFSGKSWLGYGYEAFQYISEKLSRTSNSQSKTVFCGSYVMLSIDALVRDNAQLQITSETTKFGLRIKTLRGLNQDWVFVQHPRFTNNVAYQRSALVVEMPLIRLRPKRGRALTFIPAGEKRNGWTWIDGVKEGWFGEYTLEMDNLGCHAWINQWGAAHAA